MMSTHDLRVVRVEAHGHILQIQDRTTDDHLGNIEEADIICVLRVLSHPETDDTPLWLICSLKSSPGQDSDDHDHNTTPPAFKLIQTLTTTLPGEILDTYLVNQPPEYLIRHSSMTQRLFPTVEARIIHILISTTAGTCLAADFFSSILQPLLSLLLENDYPDTFPSYNIMHTTSPDSVREFVTGVGGLRDLSRQGKKQTVMLLSGDGGVTDLVNGLLEDGQGGDRERYVGCLYYQHVFLGDISQSAAAFHQYTPFSGTSSICDIITSLYEV